eukprot:scaffold46450_cov68-Phaeocystis_antarctica.AAC.1
MQEEHVGLVAQRPPAVDEAKEEHRQQAARRHGLRWHVGKAWQHALRTAMGAGVKLGLGLGSGSGLGLGSGSG